LPHVHTFTITSGVGEYYALTFDEWTRCIDIAVEKAEEHEMPSWANFGAESYEKTIRQVEYCEQADIDAIRVVIPYYVFPSQRGYVQYFKDLAAATDLPIMLYPSSLTTRPFEPDTVVELSTVENIVGVKVHHYNVTELGKMDVYTPEDFEIIPGSTSRFYHMHRAGITGDVTIGPEPQIFPEWTSDLWDAVMAEDWDTAKDITRDIYDVYRYMIPPDVKDVPAQFKYASKLMGRDLGPCRRPVAELDEETKSRIESALSEHDLL
jgi:4-hydroxy-tetrahydrodipicolinate synthase